MKTLCCKKMPEQRLVLTSGLNDKFIEGPKSDTLWINTAGLEIDKAVVKNALVYPGMVLASHSDLLHGNLHCPIVGTVADVSPQGIMITAGAPKPKPAKKAAEGEEAPAPEPVIIPSLEAVRIDNLDGYDLREALKSLGCDTYLAVPAVHMLIINALNPDPEAVFARAMLEQYKETVQAGIDAVRRLNPAVKLVLAVDDESGLFFEGVEIKEVPAVYPSSLNALVIKAVSGEEAPDNICAIDLHTIWAFGQVTLSGLPLTQTVVSVNQKNYLATIGTPLRSMLELAGLVIEDGDSVIFNGPLRGDAKFRLQDGVAKDTYLISHVRAADIPPLEGDNPCISCGECVQVCPARLQPNKLSRFSEFAMYDKCKQLYIDVCMECGMCAYVCIARRPVLQYIRMAKKHLALQES